jgi:hypothetical protein
MNKLAALLRRKQPRTPQTLLTTPAEMLAFSNRRPPEIIRPGQVQKHRKP